MKAAALLLLTAPFLLGQPFGEPDRGGPPDLMIQEYLRQEAERIEADFKLGTLEDWTRQRPQLQREYLEMLGLWPLPERTPMAATITGTLDRGDYHVDLLHYQSRPGLYVTANLYRPARIAPGERLPAILYVCGHSSRGRNGNKAAFQSHGIWFARHGYICLVVDTLQLGEIAGVHHGTYREERWWWLSRGYTPAGVECWNGVRGIDYLVSRTDVDPERIGVTGISGGGAATFWIAAADDRVRVAVPVSGMADLLSYVPNRVINGHCDCMFLYNSHRWPWARIAALIAPRPLLFVNSDKDPIFPMDANERVINRLERVYSLFGAGDRVDSVVSIGGHDYRADIRQATYRFLNTHLRNDPRPVLDSEVDLLTGPRENIHPISPEKLRAFPDELPADAINNRIDREFVPMARVQPPAADQFQPWKENLLAQLRAMTFREFSRVSPAAKVESDSAEFDLMRTEPGISVRLRRVRAGRANAGRVCLVPVTANLEPPGWLAQVTTDDDTVYLCQLRGTGDLAWTRKNPPNYVERSHYLLGRTVDTGRVWDLASVARHVRTREGSGKPLHVVGEGANAVLGVYAALLEPDIEGMVLIAPPASHMAQGAPALLNVLRVCDIPEAIGLLAPRPVTLRDAPAECAQRAAAIYRAAGAEGNLRTE